MCVTECLYCKKNTGNRTCTKYPDGIPDEDQWGCDDIEKDTLENVKKRVASGEQLLFYVPDNP